MSRDYYEISTSSMNLKITIVEVGRLYIHEEIIPSMLNQLIDKIRRDSVFKDPIIVDEKTMVVLDGMHRVAAVRDMGYRYIPVCLVDYDNPEIKLYSWSRVIRAEEKELQRDVERARRSILDSITRLGYRLVSIPGLNTGLEMLSRRDITGLIIHGRNCTGIKYPTRDIKIIYDKVKKIEENLAYRGFSIGYYAEKDALSMVEREEAIAAILPPVITKNEVRSTALRGEVFIHKATRHVIPARPLNVNIPLNWLNGSIDLDKVKKMLVEHLANRGIKKLPPGTILDRRYEEELYVFE